MVINDRNEINSNADSSAEKYDENNHMGINQAKQIIDRQNVPPIITSRTALEKRLFGIIRAFERRSGFRVDQIFLTRNKQDFLTVQVILKYK